MGASEGFIDGKGNVGSVDCMARDALSARSCDNMDGGVDVEITETDGPGVGASDGDEKNDAANAPPMSTIVSARP